MNQAWQICGYSKSEVDRTARELAKNKIDGDKKTQYYDILADFRSAHAYPIQSMINNFRNKAFDIDKNAIVVRRLKRIPSILNKLRRQQTMRVSAMGDIGGIRVIVKNINMVYQLTKSIEHGRTQNKLVYKKDYLQNPKASGYRGIHLTYSYGGNKQEYEKYRVELQIRSQIQHSWATAVEVVGTFSRENLKAGKGNKNWLELFAYISKAFACLENNKKPKLSLVEKIKDLSNKLHVVEKLESYLVATQELNDFKSSDYILLDLDVSNKVISLFNFAKKFTKKAYEHFNLLEQRYAEDQSRDIVMVSANSIKDLKKAYPNYFSDTKDFQKTLNQIIA